MRGLQNFLVIALAMLALGLGAAPAQADWRRAESARFIVYSANSSDRELIDFTRRLERYDFVLRSRLGLPTDRAPARKLPIYLVRSQRDLQMVRPGLGDTIAGFYSPSAEDIFAVALNNGVDEILFHEYFHHFFFDLGNTSHYPSWVVEGLAEYFMTVEIKTDEVVIGGINDMRAWSVMNETWTPLEMLLTQHSSEVPERHRGAYYPTAWLLTHWFLSDTTRRTQFRVYLDAVGAGTPSVEAVQTATGLTLEQLRSELRRYSNRSLMASRYTGALPVPEVSVTRLPAMYDDLLLLSLRLKVGVPADRRAQTAELVRQRTARYPDEPFALLQLGHAELHFGDREAARPVLERLIEIDPTNVEGLQYLALYYIEQAEDADEGQARLIAQARRLLARAYEADPENYITLYYLADTRQGRPDYPTENDLHTWQASFLAAPQITGIRLGYASALIQSGDREQAIELITALANSPHSGSREAANQLLERARAGDADLGEIMEDSTQAEESEAPTERSPN